jgi:Mrp family chromosome partitioning ATPase
MLRARWWVLILIALISVWVADRLTEFRNEQRPTLEAVAAVTFLQQLTETDDSGVITRLTNAESLALELNAQKLGEPLHPLAPWEIYAIEVDPRTYQLRFIGRGQTEAEATARANELFEIFFEQEPFTGILGIQAQLDSLAAEITSLQRRIVAASVVEPPPVPGTSDFIALAELGGVRAQILALETLYNALQVELLAPIERSSAEITAEMDLILQQLVTLKLDEQTRIELLGPLAPDPVAAAPEVIVAVPLPEEVTEFSEEEFAEELEVTFWQLQSEQLTTAYQELFLRKVEVDQLYDIGEDYDVNPSSLAESEPVTNIVLAIAAGLMIGVIGLIIADRARKPLWSALDAHGMSALPEVEPRGRRDPIDVPWYTAVAAAPRKAGIQALRAVVEGLGTHGQIVGVTGLSARGIDLRELSADLAAALAVSGKSVLLIDADLNHSSNLIEFGTTGKPLVSLILDEPTAAGEHALSPREAMAAELTNRRQIVSNLRSVRSDGQVVNAPDVLARPQLGLLLDAAKEVFDVVVVSGADDSSPITQVLSQRLDHMILVGVAGRTTESDLEAVRREFGDRRANLLGLVLLLKVPNRLGRSVWGLVKKTGGTETTVMAPPRSIVREPRPPEDPLDEERQEPASSSSPSQQS